MTDEDLQRQDAAEPADQLGSSHGSNEVEASGPTGSPDIGAEVAVAPARAEEALDGAGLVCEGSEGNRTFVPMNREDILLLLSGLTVPERPAGEYTALPVTGQSLAIMAGGLRASEADQLSAGHPSRFPLLLEVREEAGSVARFPFTLEDVLGLRFRSQKELEEFTYRPVAEWHPEGLDRRVEPSLFGLSGHPRFRVLSPEESTVASPGLAAADRLAGGLATALAFAALQPDCLDAVIEVLGCGDRSTPDDGVDGGPAGLLYRSLSWLDATGGRGNPNSPGPAVTRVFVAARREPGSTLVEKIASTLSPEVDRRSLEQVTRWRDVSREVFKSRRDLDGTLLADTGSLWLRGALLAARVDTVEAISSFRGSDKPAGRRVCSLAAWLLGLRRGLAKLRWELKEPRAMLLSILHGRLQDPAVDPEAVPEGLRRVGPTEAAPKDVRLEWRGALVLEGKVVEEEDPTEVDEAPTPTAIAEQPQAAAPPPPTYAPPEEPPPFLGVREGVPEEPPAGSALEGEAPKAPPAGSAPVGDAPDAPPVVGEETASPATVVVHLQSLGCAVRQSSGEHLEVTLPGGTPVKLFLISHGGSDLLAFEVQTGRVGTGQKGAEPWKRNAERGLRWRFANRDGDLVLMTEVWGSPGASELGHLEAQLRRLLMTPEKPRKPRAKAKKEGLLDFEDEAQLSRAAAAEGAESDADLGGPV